ncbi:MAG TPA: 5-carboxymethyl-2-hydroxymuconate isomerase [Gemmatimonadota bacterium]|nr:5-carboxymethyl-2-hydroxymuconate isomerase [Gemmatimonadota bacterium]
MPHLTLEYTANLRPDDELDPLFARLHRVLAEVGGVEIGNCKSRAVERDRFFVGEGGAAAGFAHLEVRFLEGRSDELKGEIGRALLEVLRETFAVEQEAQALQISVEICDIRRATYFKFPALG